MKKTFLFLFILLFSVSSFMTQTIVFDAKEHNFLIFRITLFFISVLKKCYLIIAVKGNF
jgi:hypothetical protein